MLQYSRDELPVECPECGNVNMSGTTISRDNYIELVDCYCGVCRKMHRVRISED